MKGRWNYQGLGQVCYGVTASYPAAAQWLDQPGWTVEDWGCGCAFARRFFALAQYVGIDGSQNEFADVCGEDLIERKSSPDGILMRHVLEHNERWPELLDNALRSFQKRLVIVFFIPFGPETKVINRSTDPKYLGVPDIQFKREDIMDRLQGVFHHSETVDSDLMVCCEKKLKKVVAPVK